MPDEGRTPEQLLQRLDSLLGDDASCSWADVLATAMALREKAVITPGGADLVHALDTKVISKAHMEQGRPDLAAAALNTALSRTGATWPGAHGAAEVAHELHVRHLLNSCYQACTASPEDCRGGCSNSPTQQCCSCSPTQPAAATSTADAQPTVQQQQQQQQQQRHESSLQQLCIHQHDLNQQKQQQQQLQIERIANSHRILQLAAALRDYQQQAQAAADLAAQYMAAARAGSACRMYGECMAACSAAVAGAGGGPPSSCNWVTELLIEVVPAAVDAHLAQADAAGGRACLAAYNALLLAVGKSACEECAVCYEQLTGSAAVTLLACGHIFHRACCNEWFGHKLFEAGRFQPECPLCRQVDASLQPSGTALAALQGIQQYYCEHGQQGENSEAESGELHSEDEAGGEAGDAEIHSEDEEFGDHSDCGDESSSSDDEDGDSSSDAHSSGDADGMDVDSEGGSSNASSALYAAAAQLLAEAAAAHDTAELGSDLQDDSGLRC